MIIGWFLGVFVGVIAFGLVTVGGVFGVVDAGVPPGAVVAGGALLVVVLFVWLAGVGLALVGLVPVGLVPAGGAVVPGVLAFGLVTVGGLLTVVGNAPPVLAGVGGLPQATSATPLNPISAAVTKTFASVLFRRCFSDWGSVMPFLCAVLACALLCCPLPAPIMVNNSTFSAHL